MERKLSLRNQVRDQLEDRQCISKESCIEISKIHIHSRSIRGVIDAPPQIYAPTAEFCVCVFRIPRGLGGSRVCTRPRIPCVLLNVHAPCIYRGTNCTWPNHYGRAMPHAQNSNQHMIESPCGAPTRLQEDHAGTQPSQSEQN
jgi:hypothetical protein